jgi:hypothetical protein
MQATTTAEEQARIGQHGLAEWLVLVVTLAALVIGWGMKSYVENQTAVAQADGITLTYPANWVRGKVDEELLKLYDPNADSTVETFLTIRSEPVTADQHLNFLVNSHVLHMSQEKGQLVVLETDYSATLAGRPARTVHYAYAVTPRAGLAVTAAKPVVMEAVDTLVLEGDQLYIFTFAADAALYSQEEANRQAIMGSVRFQ